MTDSHEPDPDYMRFLEWQLTTELRRRARFGAPQSRSTSQPGRWAHRMRAAALILVSLIAGAGVVVASEQIGQARRAELLLERNRIQLELAERRMEAADVESARVQKLIEAGHESTAALPRRARERAGLERAVAHLRLQRDEIVASGDSNSTAETLTAPVVAGRDFVVEHLHVDRTDLQAQVAAAKAEEERARVLAQAGVVSVPELDRKSAALAKATRELGYLDRRIALRLEFVGGKLDPVQFERRILISAAEHRRDQANALVELLARRIERAQKLEASGFGSRLVAPLEIEAEAARGEARLAELEIELLRSAK